MSRTALLARSRPRDFSCAQLVLAVGDADAWTAVNGSSPPGTAFAFACFDDVTEDLVRRLAPRVIVSTLLARSFDCMDLAERLNQIGFEGRYFILSEGVPDPAIVRAEILRLYPGMDVEVESSLEDAMR